MNRADDIVYRKTALGVAALATRSGVLTPRARMALILVNGHDSLALLAIKLGTEAVELVRMLLDRGLVEEVVPVGAPAALAPAPAAEAVSAPAPAVDADARLASLKRTALVRLTPHFGPDVDVVCRPLLAAVTDDAYGAALAAIEAKLAIYLGRKGASSLCADLRPGGHAS